MQNHLKNRISEEARGWQDKIAQLEIDIADFAAMKKRYSGRPGWERAAKGAGAIAELLTETKVECQAFLDEARERHFNHLRDLATAQPAEDLQSGGSWEKTLESL